MPNDVQKYRRRIARYSEQDKGGCTNAMALSSAAICLQTQISFIMCSKNRTLPQL